MVWGRHLSRSEKEEIEQGYAWDERGLEAVGHLHSKRTTEGVAATVHGTYVRSSSDTMQREKGTKGEGTEDSRVRWNIKRKTETTPSTLRACKICRSHCPNVDFK